MLDVAGRIGFVRETNYGRLFDVVTEAEPDNLAYSPLGLPLHTDNPYRDPCPSVQLLHCLEPAAGGASRFADGFRGAELLRRRHPADFAVLTGTPLTFRFHDDDVDLRAVRPLIEVGPDGRILAINVNHRSMEPPPLDRQPDRFYDAYRRFRDILAAPDSVVELSLASGDLVGFDNRRVLHGRSGFPSTARRHLQGCYIDIDAVRSTARRVRSRDRDAAIKPLRVRRGDV